MEEMFKYLDGLRDSGIVNMYGARPYLENEFGIDSKYAKEVLMKWMESK